MFSSPDEACSNRSSRPDPVRVRRACIASDVSLPLVNVLDVSASLSPRSCCFSESSWLSFMKVLRKIVVGRLSVVSCGVSMFSKHGRRVPCDRFRDL